MTLERKNMIKKMTSTMFGLPEALTRLVLLDSAMMHLARGKKDGRSRKRERAPGKPCPAGGVSSAIVAAAAQGRQECARRPRRGRPFPLSLNRLPTLSNRLWPQKAAG